jgi:hypothetical protein
MPYFAAAHVREAPFQRSQRYIQWPAPTLWKTSSDLEVDDQSGTLTGNKRVRADLRL